MPAYMYVCLETPLARLYVLGTRLLSGTRYAHTPTSISAISTGFNTHADRQQPPTRQSDEIKAPGHVRWFACMYDGDVTIANGLKMTCKY